MLVNRRRLKSKPAIRVLPQGSRLERVRLVLRQDKSRIGGSAFSITTDARTDDIHTRRATVEGVQISVTLCSKHVSWKQNTRVVRNKHIEESCASAVIVFVHSEMLVVFFIHDKHRHDKHRLSLSLAVMHSLAPLSLFPYVA